MFTLNIELENDRAAVKMLFAFTCNSYWKKMFQGKENHHTFLGLAWVIHDLLMKYEGYWFFILYHPGLDVSSHSYLTITNRFLSLLFHVDVVEQISWWVIIILHLFNVSHQLFLNQTINSYPITWWCSVFGSLICFFIKL